MASNDMNDVSTGIPDCKPRTKPEKCCMCCYCSQYVPSSAIKHHLENECQKADHERAREYNDDESDWPRANCIHRNSVFVMRTEFKQMMKDLEDKYEQKLEQQRVEFETRLNEIEDSQNDSSKKIYRVIFRSNRNLHDTVYHSGLFEITLAFCCAVIVASAIANQLSTRVEVTEGFIKNLTGRHEGSIKALNEQTVKHEGSIKALNEQTGEHEGFIKALNEQTGEHEGFIKALNELTRKHDVAIKLLDNVKKLFDEQIGSLLKVTAANSGAVQSLNRTTRLLNPFLSLYTPPIWANVTVDLTQSFDVYSEPFFTHPGGYKLKLRVKSDNEFMSLELIYCLYQKANLILSNQQTSP